MLTGTLSTPAGRVKMRFRDPERTLRPRDLRRVVHHPHAGEVAAGRQVRDAHDPGHRPALSAPPMLTAPRARTGPSAASATSRWTAVRLQASGESA